MSICESIERAILGSILFDHELLDQTASLETTAFSLSSHQQIFLAMRRMAKAGKTIDPVTLLEALTAQGIITSVGGASYLASLTEGLPRRRNISEYVDSLHKQWQRRQLVKICEQYGSRASSGDEDAADLVAAADKDLLSIIAESNTEWPSVEVQTHRELTVMAEQRSGKRVMGYRYGIPVLDRMVTGLVPKELTVLGGRPQQGKSSLIAQIIALHCPDGVPIHVFSYEMSSGQLLRRIWSIVSGVAFHKLRHPDRMSDEESRAVDAAAMRVSTWPLVIDDSSSLTADQLCARARISKRKHGTRIVCVDYLQKMRFSGNQAQRYMDITAACVAMAGLAKDEDLALLLISSVSEKGGRNRNDPPTLQDFRQSGDIAYEASTALLIHREIDENTERPIQEGLIIIAKARSDESGAVKVWFNTNTLTFESTRTACRQAVAS
jgi:replicative DNA helicase